MRWISQYPDEDEILLPPLSNLEVFKEPEVQIVEASDGQEAQRMLVVPLRLNINTKTMTIDELQGRRKQNHLSLISNLTQEARQQCMELARAFKVLKFFKAAAYVEPHMEDLKQYQRECESFPEEYLNDDDHFREATNHALDHKIGTIRKFEVVVRWKQEQLQPNKKGRKFKRIMQTLGASFVDNLMQTPAIKFCNPGLLYQLRSGTEEVPWSAMAEKKLTEVFLPAHLDEQQAEIVWDCIRDFDLAIESTKVQLLDGQLTTISTAKILQDSDQSWCGLGLGTNAMKLLKPGFIANASITKLDLDNGQIMDSGCLLLAEVLKECGGILSSLNLCYNHLTDKGLESLAEALEEHSTLTELNLAVNPLRAPAAIQVASILKSHVGITRLDCSWTYLGEACGSMAEGLQHLKDLINFDFTSVITGPEGMAQVAGALTGKSKLEQVQLGSCACGDAGVSAVIKAIATWPRLKILPIVGFGTSLQSNLELAKALEGCKELSVFVLRDTKVMRFKQKIATQWCLGQLEESNHVTFNNQKELQFGPMHSLISCCKQLDDKVAIQFAESLRDKQLRFLDIGETAKSSLGPEGNGALLEILGNKTLGGFLHQLGVFRDIESQNRIGTLSLSSVLSNINLSGTQFGAVGIEKLGGVLTQLTQLKTLCLNRSYLGPQGMRCIAPVILANVQLKELLLGSTGLGNEGATALAEALCNSTRLENLEIQCNDISNEGICALGESFAKITALKQLNLTSNSFGITLVQQWAWFQNQCQHLKALSSIDVSGVDCPPNHFKRVAQLLSAAGGTNIKLGSSS